VFWFFVYRPVGKPAGNGAKLGRDVIAINSDYTDSGGKDHVFTFFVSTG
jgi:hypothetical protein